MTTASGSTLHTPRPFFGALLLALIAGGCTETGVPLDDGGGGPPDGGPVQSLPACGTSAILFYADAYSATVEASGERTYSHIGAAPPSPAPPPELTATLESVDAATSTLHLTSATGATDIVVHPVDAATLEALPIGTEVTAHFREGVSLTTADGSLLLAVVSTRQPGTLGAGPFQLTQGATTCVTAEQTTFGCVHGAVETDVDVVAEGYTATLHPDEPATATVRGQAFSIRTLRSVRHANPDELGTQIPDSGGVCGDLLPSELSVVIAPE